MKNPRCDNKTPKKKQGLATLILGITFHSVIQGHPHTNTCSDILSIFTTGSIFKHLKKTPLYKSEYVKIPVPGSLVHHFSDYFAIHCL